MVAVRPFRGLRFNEPKSGHAAGLLAPPYDVVSSEERSALVRRGAYNVIQVELPVGGDERYAQAAALLASWRRDGILTQEASPAFYLLEERFTLDGQERRRLGLLATVVVEPWSTGAVLPHERTLPGPKVDRLRLLQATRTNVSPIFLMYDDPARHISALLSQVTAQEPAIIVQLQPGEILHAAAMHRLWVITEPALVAAIIGAFVHSQAYMADGHHRYETALAYRQEQRAAHPDQPDGPWDAALMFLVDVDDPGLAVLPIHRVLHNLDGERLTRLPEALQALYRLEPVAPDLPIARLTRLQRDAGAGAMLLVGPGQHVMLAIPRGQPADRLPSDRSQAWRDLDVNALHDLVLRPLLGLGEAGIRSERFVTYTRDAGAAFGAVRSGEAQLAFLLNPTRPEQVCAVARAHDRMPQKSTFYYPKPLTGLVLYPHDR